MTEPNLTKADLALKYLQEALATGVRGDRRKAILHAIAVFETGESRPTAVNNKTLDAMKGGDKLTDPDHTGLLYRCGKDGVVAYFRFRHPVTDQQKEIRIGGYPAIALGDIRSICSDLREQRHQGKIPAMPAAMPVATMSVAQMVDRYLEEYAKPFKRSWKEDQTLLQTYFAEPYGDIPAHEITKETIDSILQGLERDLQKRGKTMRRSQMLRAVLSKVYNYALAVPLTKEAAEGQPINRQSWLPAGTANPVTMTQKPGYKAKRHSPKLAELRTFCTITAGASAVESVTDSTARKVLRLQALTFTRINEACQIEWADLDLEAGTWTIPEAKSKNRHPHTVMLSRQALALLQELAQERKGSPYVFPSATDPRKPILESLVQKFWRQQRTEHPEVSERFGSHGLRRAGAAFVKQAGGNEDIRDRLLNHVKGGVDSLYSGGETLDDAALRYSQLWADHLDSLTADNITHISEGRA